MTSAAFHSVDVPGIVPAAHPAVIDRLSQRLRGAPSIDGVVVGTAHRGLQADDTQPPIGVAASPARKLAVLASARSLVAAGATGLLVPDFAVELYRDELETELPIPLLTPADAVLWRVDRATPPVTTIGVLAADDDGARGLERRLRGSYRVLLPPAEARVAVTRILRDLRASAHGHLTPVQAAELRAIVAVLCAAGVDSIVPAAFELSLPELGPLSPGPPLLDPGTVYADYVRQAQPAPPSRPFKLGVVGGLGPSATVAFLDHLVRRTPAGRDQEHIKIVMEQNPQIPDRTAHLIGDGADPTLALFNACARLEDAGASAIVIPCNTAHAFATRLRPMLSVPIVDLITETVAHVAATRRPGAAVGLLATTGLLATRLYQQAFEARTIPVVAPEASYQQQVMTAIYGDRGIKAGHADAAARALIAGAIEHLVRLGAEIVVLGCTELPLVFRGEETLRVGEHPIALVDPSDVVARQCVALARAWRA